MPTDVDPAEVGRLFAGEIGFLDFKPVRKMAFIQFDTEKNAAAALRRLQGHTVQDGSRPLVLQFDHGAMHDSGSYVDKRRSALLDAELAGTIPYCCTACRTEILRLVAAWPLLSSPRRTVDGSFAVEEKTALRKLMAAKAPAVNVVRRDGSNHSGVPSVSASSGERSVAPTDASSSSEGAPARPPSSPSHSASSATSSVTVARETASGERVAEARHMLHCPRCDVPVAYRARPLGEPARFLFVLDGALAAQVDGT